MSTKIKPIRNKKEYSAALARIEKLYDAPKGSPQFDELEVLAILVETYEEEHFPILPPDPIAAITFRMEQMGLTRKDLETSIGSRSRVSEILTKKRQLDIPADILIGESN